MIDLIPDKQITPDPRTNCYELLLTLEGNDFFDGVAVNSSRAIKSFYGGYDEIIPYLTILSELFEIPLEQINHSLLKAAIARAASQLKKDDPDVWNTYLAMIRQNDFVGVPQKIEVIWYDQTGAKWTVKITGMRAERAI